MCACACVVALIVLQQRMLLPCWEAGVLSVLCGSSGRVVLECDVNSLFRGATVAAMTAGRAFQAGHGGLQGSCNHTLLGCTFSMLSSQKALLETAVQRCRDVCSHMVRAQLNGSSQQAVRKWQQQPKRNASLYLYNIEAAGSICRLRLYALPLQEAWWWLLCCHIVLLLLLLYRRPGISCSICSCTAVAFFLLLRCTACQLLLVVGCTEEELTSVY